MSYVYNKFEKKFNYNLPSIRSEIKKEAKGYINNEI